MKNILIAFGIVVTVALLFVAVSKAETPERITIINSGKAGGSYNARTQMYKEGLTAAGYDVQYENVGKISQAVKIFKETDKPTIMVYSNNQVHEQKLYHDRKNFIMLEYEQPMYVCKSVGSVNKTGKITVAHGKGYDTKILNKLLGKDIVLVPYKNSGAILKGILGGDVDMMVNNQGKSLKYIASGHGTCEASKKLPIMLATVIGTNVDVKKIREIIFDISNNAKFVEYHSLNRLKRSSSTWVNEMKKTIKSENLWKK
jgi:hypothetical protein